MVEDEDEIVTAHAKPVARSLDEVREATRRAFDAEAMANKPKRGFRCSSGEQRHHRRHAPAQVDRRLRTHARNAPSRPQAAELRPRVSFENVGLIALLVFGLALIAIAGSLALRRQRTSSP